MSYYLKNIGSPTQHGLASNLADEFSPMQRLIRCIGEGYVATQYEEQTANNSDPFITLLWTCYHPYANYGAYCMVGASQIINAAATLAKQAGSPCAPKLVPNAPLAGSQNQERTLYGNVYDTLNELRASGAPISNVPRVGDLFMRPSDNGRTNHAGIVFDVPGSDNAYLVTIEANVSTSGNGATTKGFQRLTYTKAQYDDLNQRAWILSARAGAYANYRPIGWQFASLWDLCDAPETRYEATLCLDVRIDCDLTPQVAPPNDDPNTPPAAGGVCDPSTKPRDTTGYTKWRLKSEIIAEINSQMPAPKPGELASVVSNLPREGFYGSKGREASPDGCWVRWKASEREPAPTTPPPSNPCGNGFIVKSCCEGASTTLRFGSASELISLGDLDQNRGAREALFSSVIPTQDFKGRGYDSKMQKAFDYVPMIRLASGVPVMVYVETSEAWAIANTLKLYGPKPKFVKISRTLAGFTGGGYAEKLAQTFTKDYWGRILQTPAPADAIIDETGSRDEWTRITRQQRSFSVTSYDNWLDFNLWKLIEALEKRGADMKARGESVVILFTGEPATGLDVLASIANTLGGAINYALPGVGSLFQTIANRSRDIYRAGEFVPADLFELIGGIGGALSKIATESGGKILGVDAQVFTDIKRYSGASNNVFQTLTANGNAVQKSLAIANIIDKQLPEITDLAKETFANQERWFRNAFADINSAVGGAISDARAAVQNVADGAASTIIANLSEVPSGLDSMFSDLFASNPGSSSSAKLPLLQDILTTVADPSVINLKPGSQNLFSKILGYTGTFVADVADASIHNALAAVATGKRIVDGGLDKLTYDSLLYKAEEFARRGWKFDVPLTIPEEKRECIQKEIAVCIGTECCPPLVVSMGKCTLPGSEVVTEDEPAAGGPVPPGLPRTTTRPACITEQGGQFVYCMPANCSQMVQPTGTEISRITRTNDGGAPYDVIATRPAGSTEWSTFTVEAYTPQGNEWVKTGTESKGDATGLISSNEFEALRTESSAPVVLVQSTSTDVAKTPCAGTFPAKLTADGTGRFVVNINGEWSLLGADTCCPAASEPEPVKGEMCCEEVRSVSRKVDLIIKEIAKATAQWTSTQTRTTTPITATYQQAPQWPLPGDSTGIAPIPSSCDLSLLIQLIEDLPNQLQSVDTVTYTAPYSGGVLPTGRTAAETADLSMLQQTLVRIEQAITSIRPNSPCDQSQILTALVRIESMLQQKTVAYDDRVLQGKLDRLTEMVGRIPTSQSQAGATTVTDTTTLDNIIREIREVRADYARTTAELVRLIDNPPVICDTEMLRSEIRTQTESIREIRTLIENGSRVDTSAIERELVRQGELLRYITTRIESGTVTVPVEGSSTTTHENTYQTISNCDDAWLREAMAELREAIRLLPDVRGDLAVIKKAIELSYQDLRSRIDEALVILRELQARKAQIIESTIPGTTPSDTTTTATVDLTRIEEHMASQIAMLRQLLDRQVTTQTTTCDVDDMRSMLRTIGVVTNNTEALVGEILTKLSQRETTTPTNGPVVVQCDTSVIVAAVREAVRESMQSQATTTQTQQPQQGYEDTRVMARLTEILNALSSRTDTSVVREVTVDLSRVEGKLDKVLEELRNKAGYDDAELRQKIDRLVARPNYDDSALREKLDLVLARQSAMDAVLVRELADLRSRVEARVSQQPQLPQQGQQILQSQQSQQVQQSQQFAQATYNERGECLDCPAYVEEHRKVFYKYPTAEQLSAGATHQQPIVMQSPCHDC